MELDAKDAVDALSRSGAKSRMAVATSMEASSEFLVGALWKNALFVE
jgi:hypothetical protein